MNLYKYQSKYYAKENNKNKKQTNLYMVTQQAIKCLKLYICLCLLAGKNICCTEEPYDKITKEIIDVMTDTIDNHIRKCPSGRFGFVLFPKDISDVNKRQKLSLDNLFLNKGSHISDFIHHLNR